MSVEERVLKCPACSENGIRAVSKPLLLFGLSVRCQLCGSDAGLGGIGGFVARLLASVAVLVSLYSSIYLNVSLLLVVVASAVLALVAIAMFLPVQPSHVRGMRRRRQERMKRTMQ